MRLLIYHWLQPRLGHTPEAAHIICNAARCRQVFSNAATSRPDLGRAGPGTCNFKVGRHQKLCDSAVADTAARLALMGVRFAFDSRVARARMTGFSERYCTQPNRISVAARLNCGPNPDAAGER